MAKSITDFKPGQVVLVTAGASGIGRCMAETYLRHDCKVHICDIAQTSIDDFLAANPNATASLTDVSKPDQVEQLFAEFSEHYDHIDILINNAGIAGPTGKVQDLDIDAWNSCINIDLNGTFYVTRKAIPLIKKSGGGSIVNMSSNAGQFGLPLRSPYTAAKWAIIGLTKTWAMELGPDQIRVNALCPCSVNGPRIDNVIKKDAQERGMTDDAIRDVYQRQSSMRLFVDAEDVANMALFLTSGLGKHISGQDIAVDGHTESLSNWLD